VTVQHGANGGFTLVEVMFAALLLTVVGAAIVSVLSDGSPKPKV
jgi:type II secretory pathway component PulJ